MCMAITDAAQEKEILSLAQVGDKESFNRLVSIYREKVIQVVYRMCGDASLAEDAAQVAFLKTWQQLPRFKQGTSFRNWLYRIAINSAIDLLRREKIHSDVDSVVVAAPGESMTDWLVQQERLALVRKAVLELPEASRAVLILKEYEYLSYREIAEILDIPIGTVMSRLNYARNLLVDKLRFLLEEV